MKDISSVAGLDTFLGRLIRYWTVNFGFDLLVQLPQPFDNYDFRHAVGYGKPN